MDGYRIGGSGWTWHEGSVQRMLRALAFVLSASAWVSLAYIAVPWLDGPRNTKVSASTTCPSRGPPPPAGQRGRRII